MLPDLLGLAVVAIIFSVPFAVRRLRARLPGAAAASPVRRQAAGGIAVPAATVQPSAVERIPYDDGPLIGGPS